MNYEKKDLIGFWENRNIAIELSNKRAKLKWLQPEKLAIGVWSVENEILKISYVFKGIKQLTNWLTWNRNKHEKKMVLKIISNNDQNLKLLNLKNNQIIDLEINPVKTQAIYTKEEKKEDIIQAYITVLAAGIFVGPIIRWLINPIIPSWIILVIGFLLALFLMRKKK